MKTRILLTNLLQQKSISHLKMYPLKTMGLGAATVIQWSVHNMYMQNNQKRITGKTDG